MTRNMTLTGLLMLASVAAAVAAPELPSDLAGCSDMTSVRVPDAAVVTVAQNAFSDPVRVLPAKDAASTSEHLTTVAGSCDVTEPYRLLHHGAMKLAPACAVGAAI